MAWAITTLPRVKLDNRGVRAAPEWHPAVESTGSGVRHSKAWWRRCLEHLDAGQVRLMQPGGTANRLGPWMRPSGPTQINWLSRRGS